MTLRLTEIPYVSLLSYSTKGSNAEIDHARGISVILKQGLSLQSPPMLIVDYVAQQVSERRNAALFRDFFETNPALVPTPGSSLMKKDTLWVPEQLCNSLLKSGLGSQVMPCLVRTIPVPKSHLLPAHLRLKAQRHYDTMGVQGNFGDVRSILLVDDFVTSGATLIGAANRLLDAFPNARIAAFAAMRAIGNPVEFTQEFDPTVGKVFLRASDGESFRRP